MLELHVFLDDRKIFQVRQFNNFISFSVSEVRNTAMLILSKIGDLNETVRKRGHDDIIILWPTERRKVANK